MAKSLKIGLIPGGNPLLGCQNLDGVVDYAKSHAHWNLMIHVSAHARPGLRLDGVICYSEPLHLPADLRRVMRKRIPRVLVEMHQRAKGILNVLPDDRAVGYLAAEHLLSLGLEHFASLAVDAPFAKLREQGFVERLAQAGYDCATTAARLGATDHWPMESWSSMSVLKRLPGYLRGLPKPLGVLVWNDGAARSVIDAALEIGLEVPEDIAVVGVDNNRMRCELAEVPLSSVDLDQYRLGFEAARWMDRMLAGEPVPDGPVLIQPKGLVARRSTDALQIDDPEVRKALRWIRDHGCRCTDLEEAMEELTISRRSLDRRFRKAIGRSMGDELRRVRLDRARQLVIETNMDLLQVALECGFSDLPHLSKSFKHTFGSPPSHYRKQCRP